MTNQGQPDRPANALFERILDAGKSIRPYVSVTPLYCSGLLSEFAGTEVFLKAEHVHPTGSFKLRGAVNKLLGLDAAAKNGVVTASSGNHGLAVAKAGADLGVSVTVYVAKSASPLKVAATKALGAKVVEVDGPPIAAELLARAQGEQAGQHYVSPYNDIDVIAGQGSIGLELFAQRPDLDAVYISVGGGGLISGVGSALKKLSPRTRIVGVWPQNSLCLLRALEAGKIVDVEESDTISDGTAGAVEPGSITLPISKAVIDETITVTEEEIRAAMHRVADAERWIIEGAAGVAVAGLLKSAERNRGSRVAAIVCGRNIELGKFLDAIRGSGQSSNDGWRLSPGNKLDSEPRP
jgi:threonine dehydratase